MKKRIKLTEQQRKDIEEKYFTDDMSDKIKQLILKSAEYGISPSKVIKDNFTYLQMVEMFIALKNDVDTSRWDDGSFSRAQMKELRLAVMDDKDPSEWIDPKWNSARMKSFRLSGFRDED